MKQLLVLIFITVGLAAKAQTMSPYALLYKPTIDALKTYMQTEDNEALLKSVQQGKPLDTLWLHRSSNRVPNEQGTYLLAFVEDGVTKSILVQNTPWQAFVTKEKKKIQVKVFDETTQTFLSEDLTIIESTKGRILFNKKEEAFIFNKSFNKQGKLLIIKGDAATINNWTFEQSRHRQNHFSPVYLWNQLWYKVVLRRRYYDYYQREGMSYIATNKPVYRVDDTLKLKAYVLNKNGKLHKDDLYLHVSYYDAKQRRFVNRNVTSLTPYRRGAYTYQSVIPDSLLGKEVIITLISKKNRTLQSTKIKIEDYTLNQYKFDAELLNDKELFFSNEPFRIKYSVVDDAGLAAMDGRIQITINYRIISNPQSRSVFILPNTLLDTVFQLDVTGRGIFSIPVEKLPPATSYLTIHLNYVSTNGEKTKKSWNTEWYPNPKLVHLQIQNGKWMLVADSVLNPTQHKIELHIIKDYFGNIHYLNSGKIQSSTEISLPYIFENGLPLSNWSVTVDDKPSIHSKTEFRNSTSQIQSGVANTSVIIYKSEGIDKKSFLEIFADGKSKVYSGFLSNDTIVLPSNVRFYQYHLIGFKSGNFGSYPEIIWVNPKWKVGATFLNLQADGPLRIYPGDTATWQLQVNKDDTPVKDFDILAMAYKKEQFKNSSYREEALSKIVSYPKSKKVKVKKVKLKNADAYESIAHFNLNTKMLKTLGADTLAPYKYMFAPDGLLINRLKLPTNLHTPQFSPFVYKGGEQLQVQAFYVNNQVQFIAGISSWAYSSEVEAGVQNISIRLMDKLITVPNVLIIPGHKTELAIDLNNLPDSIVVQNMPREYTEAERMHFFRHVLRATPPLHGSLSITQGQKQLVTSKTGFSTYGPYKHDSITFHSIVDSTFFFKGAQYYFYNDTTNKIYQSDVIFNSFYPKMATDFRLNVVSNQLPGKILKLPEHFKIEEPINYNFATTVRPFVHENEGGKLHIMGFWPDIDIYVFSHNRQEMYAISRSRVHSQSVFEPGLYTIVGIDQSQAFVITGVEFIPLHTTYIDYSQAITPIDSALKLLEVFANKTKIALAHTNSIEVVSVQILPSTKSDGFICSISGTAFSENIGETLPFANVVVKQHGRQIKGTTTDFDGNFLISGLPSGTYDVECSFAGFASLTYKDLSLGKGEKRVLHFKMQESVELLMEVVVRANNGIRDVGRTSALATDQDLLQIATRAGASGKKIPYTQNKNEETESAATVFVDGIKDSGQTDLSIIWGLPAQYGDLTEEENESQQILNSLSNRRGNIRNNFSDYAFFIPDVTTDANGKATFSVQYPDDVAKWNTQFIGMGKGKTYAYAERNTIAYSEVSATLATPRYLLQGDSCVFIGKSLNYLDTTLAVTNHFILNGDTLRTENYNLSNVQIHQLPIVAKDSLTATYSLQLQNAYTDGEQRTVPILPVGLELHEGEFWVLKSDTTITFEAKQTGPISVGVMQSNADFLLAEVILQLKYLHNCNEQLASKLRAILAVQNIDMAADRRTSHTREAKKIIKQLLENRNEEQLWGWWANQNTNIFMTAYVLEALLNAQKAGFEVPLQNTVEAITKNLPAMQHPERLRILYALSEANYEAPYHYYLGFIKLDSLSTSEKLTFALLAEKTKWPYDTAAIHILFQKDMLGNSFVATDAQYSLAGSMHNTLLGARWQLMLGDSAMASSALNYMILTRNKYWLNTIERSALIELFGISATKISNQQNSISLLWDDGSTTNVAEGTAIFVHTGQKVTLRKTGNGIAYASASSTRFEPKPEPNSIDFKINATLKSDNKNQLAVGNDAYIEVVVTPSGEARYVMLEIPIPASCTVSSSYQMPYYSGVYQEIKGDKLYLYIDKMAGTCTYKIPVLPRYAGSFYMNPVKVELMYFPTKSGNDGVKKVDIKATQ